MHHLKIGVRGRLGLLAAFASAITVFAVFASAGQAAGPWPTQNGTASYSRFLIPGAPSTISPAGLSISSTSLTVSGTAGFPPSGQILISDNAGPGISSKANAELIDYTSITGNKFNLGTRGAKGIPAAAHGANSRVKLATSLTAAIGMPAVGVNNGAQANLIDGDAATAGIQQLEVTAGNCPRDSADPLNNMFNISSACPGANIGDGITPFTIIIGNKTPAIAGVDVANFPPSGAIEISHQSTQTPNLFRGGNQTEYLKYDNAQCGGVAVPTLCIVARAQQPSKKAYRHLVDGFAQPGGAGTKHTTGKTKVDLHFQLAVKSNANFFPAGNLLVCDAAATLTNCELMGHNNAAPKIKVPSPTQFHMTSRGVSPVGSKKTAITTHAAGSLVTGADGQLFCRNGSQQPGVGPPEPATQVAGTSVGLVAACYTVEQPNPPPTFPNIYPNQSIAGQTLLVIAAIAGQPFLSTGGFCHVILGPVGITDATHGCPSPGTFPNPPLPFDNNGSSDGTLILGSPCIKDFTPGVNLQVNVTLGPGNTLSKTSLSTNTGTINVVLDTIPLTPAHTECDDPSSTDTISSTTYDDIPSAPAATDDTDRDGCKDVTELTSNSTSGIRDPFNPFDVYDINHDGTVNINVDILQTAQAFGPVGPQDRRDRGTNNFGPFSWNKEGPNGVININDDVLGVAQQFGLSCPHDHTQYTGPGFWPAAGGNTGPWYGTGIVPNH